MKVFKIKCLNCKEKCQFIDIKIVFNEGCPNCGSKRIKMIEYGKEEII